MSDKGNFHKVHFYTMSPSCTYKNAVSSKKGAVKKQSEKAPRLVFKNESQSFFGLFFYSSLRSAIFDQG